jgi:hypothetical protein
MSTGGLSSKRLGRMHDVMAGYVERGEVPGLVTLVCRRGEVHVDVIGSKSIGGGCHPARLYLPDRLDDQIDHVVGVRGNRRLRRYAVGFFL